MSVSSEWMCVLAASAAAYWAAGVAHELSHLLASAAAGAPSSSIDTSRTLTVKNTVSALLFRHVQIPGVPPGSQQSKLIRHAGWLFSFGSALLISSAQWSGLCSTGPPPGVSVALWLVAVEAIYTDFIVAQVGDVFFCGCFGLILLSPEHRGQALDVLHQMIRVTQMRGSQSGGLVTWMRSGLFGHLGLRRRIVNGKRGNLADKLVKQFGSDLWWAKRSGGQTSIPRVQMFTGHTRFATSSKATFEGTHPHRWTPCIRHAVWGQVNGGMRMAIKNVEMYVCHNGDLDFYETHGITHPLGEIRAFVERATSVPCSTPVDSIVIAGLMDLLRTKGVWDLSVRYAFLFQVGDRTIRSHIPPPSDFALVANDIFVATFRSSLVSRGRAPANWISTADGRKKLVDDIVKKLRAAPPELRFGLSTDPENPQVQELAQASVDAFFDNDLLHAVQEFLRNARGSFGLSATCSLDASREMALAAKGQTMSVAFYPRAGVVLYGSEQAAVKAALDLARPEGNSSEADRASRLDLDDLEGEICLLSFDQENHQTPEVDVSVLMNNRLRLKLCSTTESRPASELSSRLIALEDNHLIQPIPMPARDPVGADIIEIPKALHTIQAEWGSPGSLNRLSACTLGRALLGRLAAIGQGQTDGSLDVLLTGCEVSLWIAEQFASDLHRVFPTLTIRTISSNKVLGLLGHNFPVPQTGFQLHDDSLNLTNSVVIIVSHSGGTFAPLAVSKLAQAMTENLFVVTSEWDTQIARQLRSIDAWTARSRIFSTGIGLRAAEPCSISVVATHQLLTQVLLQLMETVQAYDDAFVASGATFIPDDISQLVRNNLESIHGLETIVGTTRDGQALSPTPATTEALRGQGRRWSQHVLEAPIAWMITALYVLVTVTLGYPVVSAIFGLSGGGGLSPHWAYLPMFFDALLYIFMPQIAHWLIRAVQRRPLMHRMAHRTVVIGDIPWVAQCAEAFLSKLFASSYSNTGVTVFSANPSDHLVHRLTHRVSRGTLLAVGRPDGRLSALSSAENAALLAVNQASSIQNLGHACCESITVGHNPHHLLLSKAAIFLPSNRPSYLCETSLVKSTGPGARASLKALDATKLLSQAAAAGTSSAEILGTYENLRKGLVTSDRSFVIGKRRLTNPNPNLPDKSSKGQAGMARAQTEPPTVPENSVALGGRQGSNTSYRNPSMDIGRTHSALPPTEPPPEHKTPAVEDLISVVDLIYSRRRKSHGQWGPSARASLEVEAGAPPEGPGAAGSMGSGSPGVVPNIRRALHNDPSLTSSSAKVHALLGTLEPSNEDVFGKNLLQEFPSLPVARLIKEQHLSCELYESRVASLHRLVAFMVMFHEMGKRVQDFWSFVSFGLLSYGMDRTHSVMRIATTASPVSALEVNERILDMRTAKMVLRARDIFLSALSD